MNRYGLPYKFIGSNEQTFESIIVYFLFISLNACFGLFKRTVSMSQFF